MAEKDTKSAEAPASAEETSEEEFATAFEEFAAVDDTLTTDPPAEGQEVIVEEPETPAPDPDPAPSGGEPSDDPIDPAPDAAEVEDIWADATPEQIAAFKAAEHKAASHQNRASAQNRKITELMAASQPAAAPAADPDPDATPETDESWEQFKTEYPEVATPMEKRFEARMTKLEAENTELRGQVTGIHNGQIQDAINTEEAVLADRHPDWEQLTTSPEFSKWLPDQPRYVQEGFVRNGTAIVDGQEAASLIDLFKGIEAAAPAPAPADTPISGKATRRQRRLESAVSSESSQAGPGAGPPEGDFDAAFDHFAAQP